MWWINVPPFYRETESCTKLRSLSQGSLLHLKMFNKNALSSNGPEQFESFFMFSKMFSLQTSLHVEQPI